VLVVVILHEKFQKNSHQKSNTNLNPTLTLTLTYRIFTEYIIYKLLPAINILEVGSPGVFDQKCL